MKSVTEKNMGIQISCETSLAGTKGIFVALYGNSSTETHTLKGALAFARFLRKTALKVTQWAYTDLK